MPQLDPRALAMSGVLGHRLLIQSAHMDTAPIQFSAPHCPARARTVFAIAAVALAISCTAQAAQLGAIHVYSGLGEPLDAEIAVPALADVATLAARIAPAEAYKASNLRYDPRLADARVVLKRGGDGRLYLRATTRAALDAPVVELLVEAETSNENLAGHYTIALSTQGAGAAPATPNTTAPELPQPQPPVLAQAAPQQQAQPPLYQHAQAHAEPKPQVQPNSTSVARPTPAAGLSPVEPYSSPGAASVVAPPGSDRLISPRVVPAEPGQRATEGADALPGTARAVAVAPQPRAGERPPPGRTRVLGVPKTALRPTIDGALDDAAWKNAVVSDHFWISEQQRWPGEQTEVLVVADAEYLYFGFRVYDRQPPGIEALQTRRGAGLGLDDQVAIELDPYSSAREISSYSVNANGVQDDAIAGGRARQLAWKGDWQAGAVRTAYGWSAEIAIPFSILNFEQGTTSVAVNFLRYHHRTAEWSRWADITLRGLPEEMGRLTGLELPQAGKAQPFTFMPYALVGRNVPDKRGQPRETLANAGVEIRYQPRPNLTGVVSINPDFSQIESAITNINFNYNEKFRDDPRPFFQEGSAYFGNQRGYFYSNRIPDFDVGAKFFTRTSGYQLGGLVTRAPEDRTDFVFRGERELDATHSIGTMLVATDRPDLKNALYVVRGQGREKSGLSYSFDAAMTSTDKQPGDGSRVAGSVGWARDFWSLGVSADRYSVNYLPANALLDRDLPDTSGIAPFVSYYRDLGGDGAIREVRGDLSYIERWTGDGRVQRRTLYTGGSIETRQQVRIGLWYTDGIYRPVGAARGLWSTSVNNDYYWTGALDFNTRSSRLGFGVSGSSGSLGGGDYEYTSAYGWVRPTATTFLNVTTERLSNFGDFRQTIVSAGWDITPRHGVAARYITADYGSATRLAYSLHARKNVDFFVVYDRAPDQLARFSTKVVMTFQ